MKISFSLFWLHKDGNTEEEFRDAFFPKKEGDKEGKIFRFAVADGATQGILNGKWAEILVRTFCRQIRKDVDLQSFVEKRYRHWLRYEKKYIEFRDKQNKPIQWFEDPFLQAGAFSTFLGFTLIDSGDSYGSWEAIAIGDTCLFLVRDDDLITTFPIQHSSEFNNRPLLVSSKSYNNKKESNALEPIKDKLQCDDRFYIMTDALACWFLKEYESGKSPWQTTHELFTGDHQLKFKEWISKLRSDRSIRNDDVTLMYISIEV
jgi:hypothetical protein